MALRRILRVFVLVPAKSQAGIKANSVKGGAMRKVAQNPPTKRLVAFSAREIALFNEK